MARQVNLRLDEGLLARVDAARGDVPRERWLRKAVEAALEADAQLPAKRVEPLRGSGDLVGADRTLAFRGMKKR